MTELHRTDLHRTKLEIADARVAILPVDTRTLHPNPDKYPDEHTIGFIPPKLLALTTTLIELHRANGDLAWLADMVGDAEAQK